MYLFELYHLEEFCVPSTGKPLVAYVRAWQTVLNNVAAMYGLVAFHFNTYIISILVLFYMQVKHELPKVNDIPSMAFENVKILPKIDFSHIVQEFFYFYGKTFDSKTHLISVNIGKWQTKEVPSSQKHFTVDQKRLDFLTIFLI